jgi:(p)ppGpp synthase/HD superfamily hydrolase
MSNYTRAVRYAFAKHTAAGQRRKWSDAPYIVHPIAVSKLLIKYADPTEDMLVAAVLHDTVEDTDATLDDIQGLFGKPVRDLVYWLTDVAVPSDGNRAKRMEINRLHIAQAPAEAQTIKVADMIHNSSGCVEVAGGFAWKYIPEQRAKYHLLTKAEPVILARLDDVLTKEEAKLEAKRKS